MSVRSSSSGWAFVAFPLAVIVVFTALPTVAGVALSFFEWTGSGLPTFIGIENYRAAILHDPQLIHSLRNTLIFGVATVPITVILAFLLAVALKAEWFVGKTTVRTIIFLPFVISIVAIGFVWRWVLDPHSGLLNMGLESIAADRMFADWPVPWLGDSPWALGTMCFVHIWRNLGFCVVLYLAALSRVPRSLYDAAGVDGAGSWQATWRIAWPAVRPMTLFVVITSSIWSLQVFDLVWVMTGGAEQPWTDVLNTHLYREFAANRLGYAATIGVLVLIVTAVITVAQLRWLRGSAEAAS